jgi:protein-disulfide isomerase
LKSSEVKIFSAILVVAVILVGFALAPTFRGEKGPPPPPPKPEIDRSLLVPPGSHLRGDPNAPTTVVVFSDFQCPMCKDGVPILRKIVEENAGKVNEVFHHFQAKPDHVYAQLLARASEAAAKQGKFWEMHDKIYEKQKELTQGRYPEVQVKLKAIAKSIGLDVMKYDVAMSAEDNKPFEEGNALGVKAEIPGTPSYFVIDPQGKVTHYMSNMEIQGWGEKLKKSSH